MALQRPEATGYGVTAHRLARVDVASNNILLEPNYPLVLTDRDFVVVEIIQPGELEDRELVVLLTINSLVILIFEVVEMGAKFTGNFQQQQRRTDIS